MGYIVQQQGGRRASRYASRRNADINMTNLMDVMMVLLVVPYSRPLEKGSGNQSRRRVRAGLRDPEG